MNWVTNDFTQDSLWLKRPTLVLGVKVKVPVYSNLRDNVFRLV